jgi:hypothetical protein
MLQHPKPSGIGQKSDKIGHLIVKLMLQQLCKILIFN